MTLISCASSRMSRDPRQLSIEVQSARNSVYEALGESIEKMEEDKLCNQVFKAWKVCKRVEEHIIAQDKK